MPSNRNRIDIDIGFKADTTGLQGIRKVFNELENISPMKFSGTKKQLEDVRRMGKQIQAIFSQSFNVNLNSLNLNKFSQGLKDAGYSIQSIHDNLAGTGQIGQKAFDTLARSILTSNLQLKETNSFLNKIGQTMVNTVKWGITSRIFNNITQSVKESFTYVKSLDSALNDIRIVTGASADEMGRFANQANRAAQELGRSTMDYTKAALTFYQQGLSDEDVQARTQATLKAQNITGAGQEMADYLTAVWNGYKVANEEAELYVDKLAAVADHSASNMSQLAIGMSKVASSANALNVPIDSLNAQIATIVATTRQAPEAVGNALKTIYARINDIKLGTDDAQTSLGNYSSQMAKLGFSVLDANGNLRDTGDVIEQIGGQWANLSREQQIFLARTMAGQRQYNNLIALFDNWSKYTDLVTISMQSQGATAQKNAIYLDSLAAHTEKLGAAQERLKSALVDSDSYKGLIDFATLGVKGITNFIESIGGGGNALLTFGSIATQVFSGTIAKQINNLIQNSKAAKYNLELINKDIDFTRQYGQLQTGFNQQAVNTMVAAKQAIQGYYGVMNTQQINTYQGMVNHLGQLKEQEIQLQRITDLTDKFNSAYDVKGTRKVRFVDPADQKALQDVNAKLALQPSLLDKTEKKQKQIKKSTKKLEEEQSRLIEKINKSTTAQGPVKSFASYIDSFSRIRKQLDRNLVATNASNNFKVITDRAKQLKKVLGEDLFKDLGNSKKLDQLMNKERLTQGEAQRLKEELKAAFDQIENLDPSKIEEYHQRQKMVAEELQRQGRQMEAYVESIRQLSVVKSVTQMVAGFGQIGSALNNIVNLTKIWQNDSLSTGEKIFQTMTNLSMTLGMFGNGLKQVQQGWKNLNSALAAGYLTKAGEEITETSLKAVTVGQRFSALGEKIKDVGKSLLSILTNPYFLAAAATITAITVAIKLYTDEQNKAAKAAEQAAQAAKQAKDAYNELKSSYEELKNTFSNYAQAQKAIHDMTVGTEQWKDAVRDLNQQVLELLRTYPQFAKYIENIDGQLIFSEQGQQAILEKYQRDLEASQAAATGAAQRARQTSLYSNATNIGRTISSQISKKINSDYTSSDQYIGNIFTPENIIKMAQALNEGSANSGAELGELIEADSQLYDEINDIIPLLSDIQDEILQNIEARQAENKVIASGELQNKDFYKNASENIQGAMQAVGGALYQQAYNQRFQSWSKILIDDLYRTQDAQNQDWGDQVLKAVQIATGKALTWAENSVQGSDTERKFYFRQEGQTEDISYNADYIASIMAASQAMKQFQLSIGDVNKVLQATGKIDLGGIINDYIADAGFGSYTQSQLEQMAKETTLGTTYLQDLLGTETVKALAQASNQTIQQYEQRFANEIIQAAQKFDTIVSQASPKVKDVIENKLNEQLSNVNLDTKQAIVNTLQQAYNQGGKAGLDTLTTFYEQIDNFDALEDLSNEINWSTITANGLRDALSRMGIETSLSEEYLWAFIDAQRALRGVELPSPEQNAQLIQGILGNLKPGDTVSSQDWTKLVDAGYEDLLRDFFTYTETGAMELKEDAEGFQAVVKDITLQPFIDQAEQLQARQEALNNWNQNRDNVSRRNTITQTYYDDQIGAYRTSTLVDQQQARNQAAFLLTSKENLSLTEDQLKLIQEANDADRITLKQANELTRILQQQHISEQQLQQDIRNNAQAQQHLNKVVEQFSLDADINTDQFEKLVKYLQSLSDEELKAKGFSDTLNDDQEAAKRAAQQVLRYAHAIKEVNDNYDDWITKLGNWEDLPINQQATLAGDLQNAYGDALNIDGSLLSADFYTDINNLNLLKAAAQGSEEALNSLRQAAAHQYLIDIGFNEFQINDFQSKVDNLFNQFNPQIKVGAEFKNQDFLKGLTQIVDGAHMTAEQVRNQFAAMGYDVVIHEAQAFGEDYIEVPQIDQLGSAAMGMSQTELAAWMAQHTGTTRIPLSRKIGAFSIESITKNGSSGGNIKTPSGGGSSGGGGGGGAKTASKQTITPNKTAKDIIKNVPDRDRNPYQNIQRSLQNQNDLISQLNDQQERLTGEQRLNNLQAQNQAIEEQINLEQQRLNISAKNVKGSTYNTLMQLKSNTLLTDLLNGQSGKRFIQSHYQQDAYGNNITDANGNQIKFWDITNPVAIRDAAQKARMNIYNEAKAALEDAESIYLSAIEAWNAKDAEYQNSDQGKKAKQNIEKVWETAQNTYNTTIGQADTDFNNAMSLLDQFFSQVQDDAESVKNIIKAQREQWQIALSDLQLKIQANINIGQLERDYLQLEEKILKHSDKNYDNRLKKLQTYYQSRELQAATTSINQMQRALEVARKKNQGKNLTEDEKGILEKWGDDEAKIQQIISNNMQTIASGLTEIYDIVQDIHQSYLDAAKQYIDSLDKYAEGYQRILDVIDNTSSIAEILYGENPTIRSGFYVKQLYYNREYLKKLQENYKLAQQKMNDESLDEQTRKEWRNKFYDFSTQLQQQMSTSLQFAVDQFENNLERAVQNVSKNLNINLDSADLQWDAQQKIDDRFLDDVNSKYAQDSIARLYQNAVDAAAGDVSQQQRLKSVMQQQLKILKDKDKLTQYDVDRAKKVLQLEKARMALEDARNNKTKMRLRRDSQGNYRYEYVADEAAVNDLEQKIADLENDKYNLDKQQYEKNLKDLRDVYEDYLTQRAELEKQLRQAATEDEKIAIENRIETLKKYYGDYYDWLNKHNREYVQSNLKDSAGNNILPYAAQQDNIYQQMADTIAGKGGLIQATKSLSTDFNSALNTYNDQLQKIAEILGLAKDAFTNGYQGIDKDELNSLPFFRDAKEYLKDMSTQIEEAKTAMDNAAELDIEANDYLETISSSINSWREAYQKGFDINLQINRQAGLEDIANKPLEKYTGIGKPVEMATGGMTPAWGNEGKIAILHEKELVLNEQDTANMLQAFMIARELARGIMNGVPEGADLQKLEIAPLIEEINTNIQSILATLNRTAQEALKDAAALALQGDALSAAANLQAVSYSLDEKMASLQNALLDFDRRQYEQNLSAIEAAMKAYQSQASSTLDQQVHIEASFPNVTQHQEIENAFNNLINMASMYASKTQSGLASRIPASPFNIS